MMRNGRCALAVMLVTAAVFTSRAAAQSNQQADWCIDKGNTYSPDLRINGCTAVIQSGKYHSKGLGGVYTLRGFAFAEKRDYDRAIEDYSQAIQNYPNAETYNDRGVAYALKGDPDRAIADFDKAIELDAKYVNGYQGRGFTYQTKSDLNRAIADYNRAIQLNSKLSDTYRLRGLANLYEGALPRALADLNQSSALDPKDAYTALWLDVVNQRSNLPSRLTEATAQIDMTKWPAPVIRLYLGQMTPAAVLAAADDPDTYKQKGQVCDANFFGGELALRQGNKDEATRLFRIAAQGCPKNDLGWANANAELKALGAQP